MQTRRIITAGLLVGVLALAQAGTLAAQGQYAYQTRQARNTRLTGTFQLDRTRSADPYRAVELALRQVSAAERDRVSARLTNRLDPPDRLTIDRSGTRIRMASTRAPEMSFVADGRSRVETGPAGRRVTTRSSLIGERLEISTRGAAGNDFTATFDATDRNTLRVTRRLYDERLQQPVTVDSFYRRVSDTPDWDVYAETNSDAYDRRGGYQNDDYRNTPDYRNTSSGVLIPNGSTMFATLDQSVNLRSRSDDRITLTVSNAPRAEFEGAVIEGSVVPTSQSTNGRTGVTMAFDRIRLRDGRTADFNGIIEAMRGPDGQAIDYNGEQIGTVRDRQDQAIERGAIGAAIGALIGAVAGGGKGAAIGAAVGGGGAAATVFVDQLNRSTLERGTEFTIRTQQRR